MVSELCPGLDQIVFILTSIQMIFCLQLSQKSFCWILHMHLGTFLEPFLEKDTPSIWGGFCKIYLFISIYTCLTSVKKLLGQVHSFEVLRQTALKVSYWHFAGVCSIFREIRDFKLRCISVVNCKFVIKFAETLCLAHTVLYFCCVIAIEKYFLPQV